MRINLTVSLTLIYLVFFSSCTGSRQLSELSTDNDLFFFRDKLYSGQLIEYYPDKTKKYEFTINNGKKGGDFKYWHPNGQLKMSGRIDELFDTVDQHCLDKNLILFDPLGTKVLEKSYLRGFWIPEYEWIQSPYTGKIWMDRNPRLTLLTVDHSEKNQANSFYFKILKADDSSNANAAYSWKKWSPIPELNKIEEITREQLSIYERNAPCPPGYRLPFTGEIEEELSYAAISKSEEFDLNLMPEGKWSIEKRELKEYGEKSYYWVQSEFGYLIAHIYEGSIEYKRPESEIYYSIRCLFNPNKATGKTNLKRAILKYGPTETLINQGVSKNETVVIRICVDRNGIVFFKEIKHEKTTIQNEDFHQSVYSVMDQFIFAADDSAPELECGDYTIRLLNR